MTVGRGHHGPGAHHEPAGCHGRTFAGRGHRGQTCAQGAHRDRRGESCGRTNVRVARCHSTLFLAASRGGEWRGRCRCGGHHRGCVRRDSGVRIVRPHRRLRLHHGSRGRHAAHEGLRHAHHAERHHGNHGHLQLNVPCDRHAKRHHGTRGRLRSNARCGHHAARGGLRRVHRDRPFRGEIARGRVRDRHARRGSSEPFCRVRLKRLRGGGRGAWGYVSQQRGVE